jgi:hypothetical protein
MQLFGLRVLSIACAVVVAGLVEPARSWPVWWHKWRSGNHDSFQRNFNTISNIYNLTVYPHQVPIIFGGAAGVPPGLFNQDVVGRVDPVGDFIGFDDSIEYFFALAPLPQGNAVNAAITGYQIAEFSSACRDVAASVVYLYTSIVNPGSPDNGKPLAPLKQIAFWRFDDCGAVLKYDAWIPNLNDWLEATTAAKTADPQYRAQSIQQLCAVTEMRCTGANTQWNSTGECIGALSQKPYGTYDEAWGDNIVCRTIHIVLTQVRPDVSFLFSSYFCGAPASFKRDRG